MAKLDLRETWEGAQPAPEALGFEADQGERQTDHGACFHAIVLPLPPRKGDTGTGHSPIWG